jgi:hypothetical protein
MAILATGNTFNTGDSVTATMLNNSVNNATFASGAVDGVTTQLSGGAVIVKDGGITASKLSTGGPTWTSGGVLTAGAIENTPIGEAGAANGVFAGLTLASDYFHSRSFLEKVTTQSTALTGTVAVYVRTASVINCTSNPTANWTLNVQSTSSVFLNTAMVTGECLSLTLIVPQGSTAYYQSAMQIDGNAVTPKWAGGSAPTAGNANSVDVYAFTIIKTANATFTVLASQTKFA